MSTCQNQARPTTIRTPLSKAAARQTPRSNYPSDRAQVCDRLAALSDLAGQFDAHDGSALLGPACNAYRAAHVQGSLAHAEEAVISRARTGLGADVDADAVID